MLNRLPHSLRRPLLLGAAAAVGLLGFIGLVLPLLPGIPLLLVAAFLLASVSETWRTRLRAAQRRLRARHALVPVSASGLGFGDRMRLRFWQTLRLVLDIAAKATGNSPGRSS